MKKTTTAILLIASLNNIFGQGNQGQYDAGLKNVPTSPEIALLGRFGDIPVGYYTGTAEVSVPLYNLKVDNIEIPLALSYHTSGIKVADEATWVGLGWNFMPEGTITQEIRGKEDYWLNGGDGFANNSGYNIFKSHFPTLYAQSQISRFQVGNQGYNTGGMISVNPSVDDSEYIINDLNQGKGQPDIFTYNFYGYSGKFFFNLENGNEILFMESNDDVKFSKDSQGWIATTNKGDKLYFYAIERSRSGGIGLSVDIGYTFKVSRIELVSGKTIIFTYQDEKINQVSPVRVAHITNFSNSNVITNNNIVNSEKKTLIGIETDDTKIDFNLNNREDIRPQTSTPIKKLESIDIKSKFSNKKIKSYVLGTSYFNPLGNDIEEGYKNKRLKLDNIQEITYNENDNSIQNTPPYKFEYDMTNIMPSKISSSDFYGYNNGAGSTAELLPDLTFFDYLNKSPYKNYGLNVNYPYYGTMRYAVSNYAPTNILKKITYPTGARTEFEYESNTFSNQFIPTPYQASLANKDGNLSHRGTEPDYSKFVVSAPFKLTKPQNIKFYNTIYDGYMGPQYPEVHYEPYGMWDCKIKFIKRKIINGQPVESIFKQWAIDVGGPTFEQTHSRIWNEEIFVPYDDDPTTEYYVRVENPLQYRNTDGMHRAIVSTNFKYYDDTNIDKSISYGNGVRVKSIKNYENDILLAHKEYSYTGGKLIYKFEPLNLITGATYKSQPMYTSGGCFIENVSVFNDLSVNSSDFGIGGNKPFGYSEVIEKDINITDGSSKGFTKYYFKNTPSETSFIKGTPKIDIPDNGENTMIEKYDQNQNKLSSIVMIYDNLPNTYGVFPSFSIINTSTGVYDPNSNSYPYSINGCSTNGTVYTGNSYVNPIATTKYRFIFNPLVTGKRRLKTTINTSYFGSKSLVDKTEMTYTASGNLKNKTITASDGKVITTSYDYAGDVINNRLINEGMTGIPLKVSVNLDGTFISKVETKYDNPVNLLPSSIVSTDLQNVVSTEVTYDKYDSKGNLQQYTTKDGISTVIIWGYNLTWPIAKIEGAVLSDLQQSLIDSIVNASNTDASAVANNDESAFLSVLNTFKNSLPNYQITTYTYDPLIGVRSITPPSGIRERYIYDATGRLEKVIDMDGKVLKEMKYNYKN